MARSAVDCGAILGVIAGQDPKDTTSVPLPVPDYLASLSGDLRGVTIPLFVSVLLGLVFGVIPAIKASKMTPVDALRDA